MESSVKLKTPQLPKMLGELMHSNQVLKLFALSGIALSFVACVLALVLASRPPLVLTLATNGESLERAKMPRPEDQVRAAISRYLELRYRWEPGNVKQKLQQAEAFVLPNTLKVYQLAVGNVAKFSAEKAVSQRVYPDKIDVDLEKKTVTISGDRITAIQGLKAAGDLRLELSFESGPRTKENPWGIYIAKEREHE